VSENDPRELADRLERETNDLSGKSDDLQGKVREVSQDWERKRADGEAPGALPDQGEMGARERGEPVEETSVEGEEEESHTSEASGEEAEPSQDEGEHEGSGETEDREPGESSDHQQDSD
jgi:hypothetical protein